MIILGLDTTGPYCSACLCQDGAVLAYQSDPIGRGHAERLGPMVQTLLQISDLEPSQIDRIAVCTGPGSFTGLRVALSFAKGFALPRQTPVLGLSALSVAYLTECPDQAVFKMVYKDVKRGQVMFAEYGSAYPLSKGYPKLGHMDDVRESAKITHFEVIEADFVDVRVMAHAAADLPPDDFPANPLYARAPDAKLPGGVTPPPGQT